MSEASLLQKKRDASKGSIVKGSPDCRQKILRYIHKTERHINRWVSERVTRHQDSALDRWGHESTTWPLKRGIAGRVRLSNDSRCSEFKRKHSAHHHSYDKHWALDRSKTANGGDSEGWRVRLDTEWHHLQVAQNNSELHHKAKSGHGVWYTCLSVSLVSWGVQPQPFRASLRADFLYDIAYPLLKQNAEHQFHGGD